MRTSTILGFAAVTIWVLGGFLILSQDEDAPAPARKGDYDPLYDAIASIDRIGNWEATVPSQCYTKTDGVANPCWTCHTTGELPNEWIDWDLQEEYAFSDFAMTNRWSNLFGDRSEEIAAISDEEALAYVRGDNFSPLVAALENREDYPGYVPDLDFAKGFDREGFARDGSGWRAIRYKPFLGTFWPTNGSTDDVFIRLPEQFRTERGVPSRAAYKMNFAILEAAIAAGPMAGDGEDFHYPVERVDELCADRDLDKDGEIGGLIEEIVGFPTHYAADAAEETVTRYLFPEGTEFLHTVRYLDPEAPGMTARRMKEVRYSKKVQWMDTWALSWAYEHEINDKEQGSLPFFAGSPLVGLRSKFGWQLQGFIEDAKGRLRLQTHEEHQFCMGCHGPIGVTVDTTFSLARKVPGAEGWRYQNSAGIPDVPQQGHERPEIEIYFRRVTGGDELRANDEMLERFFNDGEPIMEKVSRAAPGGDKDITFLINPSRARALRLNKAYMALVREQNFIRGRDTIAGTISNVHGRIENGATNLSETGKVFKDGRLWLDWSEVVPKQRRQR